MGTLAVVVFSLLVALTLYGIVTSWVHLRRAKKEQENRRCLR